jgi:hypothetical protein
LLYVYVQLGVNSFTAMTPNERSKFLGLRLKGKACSPQQTRDIPASISSENSDAGVANAAASMRQQDGVSAQQLDGIPDWSTVLPAIKNQGGERGTLISKCGARSWAGKL